MSYLDRGGALAHDLVDFKEPVAVIPSLAIHLDREANESRAINAQTYLPPVLGGRGGDFDLKTLLRQRLEADAGAEVGQVLDHELVLYDTQRPAFVGLAREFIASARLDNLLSCFTGLRALLEAGGEAGALLVCNDHEEVGSTTASGARGPMLTQTLERLLPVPEDRNRALSRSMLISADNAPWGPPQLCRPARRQPRSAAEPRTGHQDQRQPALCHQQRNRGGLSAAGRRRGSAGADLRGSQRHGVRQHHRTPGGGRDGRADRGTWECPSGPCIPSGSWRERRTRST